MTADIQAPDVSKCSDHDIDYIKCGRSGLPEEWMI